MKNKMTKYYIGLTVLGIIVFVMLILTISLGSNSKQDDKTYKKASEVASKLNSYITRNNKIPQDLNEAGIKDVPDSIKYTKYTDTYKVCVTYKTNSDYDTDPTSLIWGSALNQTTQQDYPYDSYHTNYQPTTLYFDYYHKKGEKCYTVKPYLYNYTNFNNYNYYPPSSNSTSINSTARDTERKTDIKAIASHLEAYYAQSGKYPTFSQLGDSTWRSTNLKGLDSEALKDPGSKTTGITTQPGANIYSYEPKKVDGKLCLASTDTCVSFILTATLESGTTYVQKSLNP